MRFGSYTKLLPILLVIFILIISCTTKNIHNNKWINVAVFKDTQKCRQGKEEAVREFKVDKYVWNDIYQESRVRQLVLIQQYAMSKVCTKNLSRGIEIERYYKCKQSKYYQPQRSRRTEAQTQRTTHGSRLHSPLWLHFISLPSINMKSHAYRSSGSISAVIFKGYFKTSIYHNGARPSWYGWIRW